MCSTDGEAGENRGVAFNRPRWEGTVGSPLARGLVYQSVREGSHRLFPSCVNCLAYNCYVLLGHLFGPHLPKQILVVCRSGVMYGNHQNQQAS